jgi:hypothetical protein
MIEMHEFVMQEDQTVTSISFKEIVQGRNTSVRVIGKRMLHAVDLVAAVTGKDRNDSGQILRRLKNDIFPSCKLIKQASMRTLISFQDAVELIMVLPGSTAKHTRKMFADIIMRYLDGDSSMCEEIETNSQRGIIRSCSKFANDCLRTASKASEDNDTEPPPSFIPEIGYVYATKSAAFPGLIKIGKTCNISKRLPVLNTSCAPAPHVIVAIAPTFDNCRDEKTAHVFFDSKRREGEFFEIGDADVISFFNNHITAQYNIELAQRIAHLQGTSMSFTDE